MSRDDDRSTRRRGDDEDRGRSRDRDDDRGSRDRGSERSSRDEPRSRGRDDDSGRSRGRDDDRGGRSRDDDRGGRSSGRRFEYKERDDKQTKQRGEGRGGDFDRMLKDGIKMFTPSDGENLIRFLPPTWDGAQHFGLDIYVHYGVGAERGSYLDLQKMKGEPDPITEEWAEARRDGDDDYAKQISAKQRVLVYLIDRNNEKEGVQAWAMPFTLDRDIVKVSTDRKTGEVLKIDHPEYGYDVSFDKEGSKDRTKYLGVQIARRDSPLGKDAWLDFAMDNPLPEQLVYYPYDHIAKAFGKGGKGGGGSSRDRDDDRGGRDRERDSGRDRDEDRERGPRGEMGRRDSGREEPKLSWTSVHDMTGRELEDLIDQERLDIDPREAKDDEDLADWICDKLGLKKEEATRRRAVEDEEPPARRRAVDDEPPARRRGGDDDPPASERLRGMRERRD